MTDKVNTSWFPEANPDGSKQIKGKTEQIHSSLKEKIL